jgi:hypothetical protein
MTQLRVWEKTNTHRVSSKEEAAAKRGFLDAVETLHASQELLAPDARFQSLLERIRGNVLYVQGWYNVSGVKCLGCDVLRWGGYNSAC